MRTAEQHSRECIERYTWYKDMGICTTCGRVWAEPGRVRCKTCEVKIKAYHDCKKAQRAEAARTRRRERIEQGLCTQCGRKATEGLKMCQRCREMRNDSTRKYKIHQRTLRMMEGKNVQGD